MTILENPKRSKMHPGGHLQPFGVENQNYGLSIYLSVKKIINIGGISMITLCNNDYNKLQKERVVLYRVLRIKLRQGMCTPTMQWWKN